MKQRAFFSIAFFLGCILFLPAPTANAQTVDCSVSANCTDAYCNFAANIERGCRCFDGIDNDADGKIDKADSNCAQYYGLSFVGEGSDCSIVPPGSSDPFDLVDEPISTSQNTSDTQSKISVGDLDGDGIPEAVFTSKFGRYLRVAATSNEDIFGYDEGEVKAEWKTEGQGANIFTGSGDCSPQKVLWEHENAIADIDGDGKGEVFAIVSNRGNATGSLPKCFYLVGFRYEGGAPGAEDGELVPLYNAVSIGSDRPGVIGIADMDGDGKAEVYFRDRIYAAETGKLLAYGNGNWDLDVTSGSVAANISGDNQLELICGTKIYSIPTLTTRSPATPQLMTPIHDMNTVVPGVQAFVKLSTDSKEYGVDTHSMCSVADIDRDGHIDVVISGALNSTTGRTAVFYWNVFDNTVMYTLTPSSADLGYTAAHTQYANYLTGWIWGTGRVNIGDANGDGRSDMSFVAGAHLFVMTTNAAGTALETVWTQNLTAIAGNPAGSVGYRIINDSRSGVIGVTIYDFNNDGEPSLVYRDQNMLVVVDGAYGTTVEWDDPCNSHTYTESPIVADVNGDGATDICVPCSFQNFDPEGDLSNQALGHYRLYYSQGNEWLPTRKVWNQHGYMVVNINDDLTLPFPQLDQNLIFGTAPCPNGTPGPQMPLNVFMNQVPNLSPNGCPVFPAPDLSYVGDNPDNPGVDENGDGVYTPAVEVVPPICGNLGIQVRFNIINDGDLPITGSIPYSFWKSDPTAAGVTTAERLSYGTIAIANLGVDQTLTTQYYNFNGTGGTFRLYIVLNNDGTGTLPINLAIPSATECRIDNNIYDVLISPDPFTTTVEKIADNFKCANSAPNTGELRARIFKGGIEDSDYSQYAFQWYTGPATSPVIIPGATNYNLTALAEGTYTVRVQNTAKGCYGEYVEQTIIRTGVDPDVIITATPQTLCNPANGTLTANVVGGNTGYTFTWYDIGLNPLGIVGSVANNMAAGNYKLIVSRDGCNKQVDAPPIDAPPIPDVTPAVLQEVVDCVNPNSGSITATAFYNGVAQDPANYTFNWYLFANGVRGSILPPAHGTGPTRTGLPVGQYQIEVRDNATQCVGNQTPVIPITSQTVLPIAAIQEVAPQTSCDPLQPNGILTASATGGTLVSPNDFTFQWFRGDNTLPENLVTTVSGLKGETANQVAGGGQIYTVRVTTPNNCSDTETFVISQNVIHPVVTLDSINNSICNPALASSQFNGSVISTVRFNGVVVTDFTNYQFTWHDGSLSSDPVIGGNTPTLSQVDGGFYTLVAERTDLHCASNPVPIEVLNRTVLPRIKTDSIASTNCVVNYNGNMIANGSATVTLVDGAAPTANYTFLWSDNSSSTDADGRTTQTITNIQGGFIYTVQVTNTQTGCQNTDNVPLPDASVVPVADLDVLVPNGICNPALTNPPVQYNGRLQANFLTPSGNAADYKYTWRNVTGNAQVGVTPPAQAGLLINQLGGLNGGLTYGVIAENTVLGCTSGEATEFLPNQFVIPKIKTDSIASTNCVVNYNGNMIANGEATVLSINGAAPTANFTYLWSDNGSSTDADGRSTQTITDIQGGFIYTVQVTSLLTGCQNTDPVPLADASVIPVASLTVLTENGICNPALTIPPTQFNGSLQAGFITPSGNAADYKYTWTNVTASTVVTVTPPAMTGFAVNQLGGLNGGITYGVIAENTVLGCTSGQATRFLPNQLVLPKIKTDSIASTNCVLMYDGDMIANGQATVLSVDGNNPVPSNYTFVWSDNNSTTDADGRTTQTIDDIQGGFIYTVQVTNRNTGCQNTDPVPLADASVVPVATLTVVTPNGICDPTLTNPPTQYSGRIQAAFTTTSGNLADYKYTWSNITTPAALGETPPAQTGLPVNEFGGLNGGITYGVIAENTVLGCTSGQATRFLPNEFVLPRIKTDSIGSTNCEVTFNGLPKSNGQASVLSVDGLNPPPANYTFAWTDNGSPTGVTGLTTRVIDDIQGGFTYTVEVINRLTGCRRTDPVDLPDDSVIPVVQLVVEQENGICNPLATNPPVNFNGRIAVNFTTNSGNPTDYEYTWRNVTDNTALGTTPPNNNGQGVTTELQFGGLEGGKTYSVLAVNDVLGCTAGLATVPLGNLFVYPRIKTDSIPSTNCEAIFNGAPKSNGMVEIQTIDNGTSFANYTIVWSDDGATPTPIATPGAITHNNMEGGHNYSVVVTSLATGCPSNHTVQLPSLAIDPVIAVTKTADNVNCDASLGSTGALIAAVSYDGVSVGSPPPGNIVITWSTTATGETLTNVGAGNYTAQAVDNTLGCTTNTDGDVVLDDFSYPDISIPTPTDQTSCDNTQPNGAMQATVTITSGTFEFEWFQGVGVLGGSLQTGTGQANGTVLPLINRISDDYTVWVRNEQTGCETLKSAYIPDDIDLPEISLVQNSPVTSCINPNGQITTSLDVITNPGSFTIYYLNEVNGAITSNPVTVKNTATNTFANGGLVYANLLPGNYSVLVTDDVTHCDSQVSTIAVNDNTINATVTVTALIPETSCGSGSDGSIDISVAPPAGYNFEWYTGGPTNVGPFNFFLNAYLPTFNPAGAFAAVEDVNSLSAGAYTVVVRNAITGCGTVFSMDVPFAEAPDVTVNKTNSQFCDPGPHNGEVDINIQNTGPVYGDYRITFYSGSNDIAGNLLHTSPDFGSDGVDNNGINGADDAQFDAAAPGIDYNINSLAPGDYLVKVTDLTLSAATLNDCSVYETVTIAIDPKIPLVTLGTILPNTSCDMATGDGSVEITVNKQASDPTTPSYEVLSVTPAPTVGAYPVNIATNVPTTYGGFASQLYTITVRDQNSGCQVDKVVNVPDQPVVPQIFTVAQDNESYCAPLTNGEIRVTAVGPGGIVDYDFEWYTSSNVIPANLAYSDPGAGATNGQIFNGTKLGWFIGATPGSGHGNRTYYVRGRRNSGTGIGCYTQLEQRTVIDQHVTPNISLSTFDNTSCVPAAGEGLIRATTDIAVDPLDANVQALGVYTYTWTPDDPLRGNDSGGAGPANGVGIARNADFDITFLTDGPYTVRSVNSVSGCAAEGSTNITTNPLPITLLSYTKQDQLMCDPDGNIRVMEVEIDASNSSTPVVYTFSNTGAAATDLVMNFDFKWYLANNDNDNNNSTFDDTDPLPINDEILTEDGTLTGTPFATFGAGSYFVIATRKAGQSPGNGCSTTPVRVDIIQDANTPVITDIDPFANTSCISTIVEGRIVVKATTASGVPAESGSTYSIVWDAVDAGNVAGDGSQLGVTTATLGGASGFTIPPGYGIPPVNMGGATPALRDDVYNVTLENDYSGCTTTAQVTITPERFPVTLISFTKQDQLICDVDGRITVTAVTIDGTTSGLPVYNYNTNTLLADNWDFQWFNADNDSDANSSTFDDTDPITNGNGVITDVELSDDNAVVSAQYPTMGAGTYYVIATRKPNQSPGAGCSTTPVQVEIVDDHINPEVTDLDAFANTSCDANVVEGRIELDVATPSLVNAESTSTYTYLWTPTNSTVGTIPSGGASVTIPPTYVAPPAVLTLADALVDDTYTITIRNDYSNCTTTAQAVVPRQRYPITLISFTSQDQLICDADGRITVTEVTIDGTTSQLPTYTFTNTGVPATNLADNFDFQWFSADNDGDNNANTYNDAIPLRDGANAIITDVVLSEDIAETSQPYLNMGAGSYYVLATRKPGMAPGAGCSTLPIRVNISDEHINPEVTDLDAFANTSCDANVVEGRIELDVTTASGVPAESGSTYTYVWTPANNTVGTIASGGASVTIPPTYMAPPAVLTLADALVDDTYTITVTNDYSNCSTTAQAIITPQRYPITLISFTSQNQLICDPDGRITVTQVTIDGSTSQLPTFTFSNTGVPATDLATNFDFQWYNANNDGDNNDNTYNPTIPILDGTNNPITDVVLSEDGAETTQPFLTMGAGSYYVLATRKPGMAPGAGCSTLPVRVNITDEHINPEITNLDAFANTSCDANVVEGRIELAVNTTSAVPAESGSTYTYTWTPTNNTTGSITSGAAAVTIPPTYMPPPTVLTPADALKDDTYTITVVNDYSNCSATAQAIITPQRYPIAIISVTKQDQMICYPDGNVTVTEVTIDGSTSQLPTYTFNTSADLQANFDFSWFAANNDGDNNSGTFSSSIPILDGVNNPITDVVLSEDGAQTTQPYTTMGAGTYYVMARRKPGMVPGAGCFTEPVRVDISDLHVNPTVSLTYIPNTSCDPINPNGEVIAVAEEANGANTDTYTFTWTLNNGPLFGSTIVTNPNNFTGQLTDAAEGDYVVLVQNQSNTGCQVTGNINVVKDLNISLPNIIDVATVDPLNCLPSASAEVTRISIGGVQFFNTPPDNLDTNFDFEWYSGDFDPANIIAGAVNHDITNITPGTYYVTVEDLTTACRSTPKEVVINDDDIVYPVVAITQSQLQVSCDPLVGTAALQATADGQTDANPNYSFTWFNNLNITPPSFATTSTITNLLAGEYSVSATDATTGCSSNTFYIVPDDAPRFLPVLSLSQDPRVNCLVPDGQLLAREIGYNPNSGYPFPPNYGAELYVGATPDLTVPGTVMTNVPGFNRNWLATGLDIVVYTVKLTDNNTGCVVSGSIQIEDVRIDPKILVLEENPLTNCDVLRPNGQLFASADGEQVGGYSFEWYSGQTVTGTPITTENILIGATAGNYIVRVTNNFTGCFADEPGEITNGTVPAPTPTPEVKRHLTRCLPPADGWVTATVNGGVVGYDFFWYDGETDDGTPEMNGYDYTQIPDGPYTVKVMDVITGCYSEPVTVIVENHTEKPIMAFETTPSFCTDVPGMGTGTGSVTTVVTPNNLSIESLIFTGIDDPNSILDDPNIGVQVGEGSYVHGLYPGFYQADVMTTKGCTGSDTVEIKTEIRAYNLVTQNNDAKNDAFVIDCISQFPNNNVKIFNRSGVLVYEADGYDNNDKVFKGVGENGLYTAGNNLPVGTYFYIIDKRDGSKPRTGYLELVK